MRASKNGRHPQIQPSMRTESAAGGWCSEPRAFFCERDEHQSQRSASGKARLLEFFLLRIDDDRDGTVVDEGDRHLGAKFTRADRAAHRVR